jgi:ADP-ribose pyrophosphatase
VPRLIEIATSPDGYQVVQHPGAVAIIPVTSPISTIPYAYDDQEILLCKQYRKGVKADVLEIPAGTRDVPGEPPRITAIREMMEEIGQKPDYTISLGSVFTSPGFCNESIELYLGWYLTECSTKEFEPIPLKMRDVWDLVLNNEITDAKTIVALQRWELLSRRLGWGLHGSEVAKIEIVKTTDTL